jgi:hypothetical protein
VSNPLERLIKLLSVNNPCKYKGDRKGHPYERTDSKHIRRGDLYGCPCCTDYLQKVKFYNSTDVNSQNKASKPLRFQLWIKKMKKKSID